MNDERRFRTPQAALDAFTTNVSRALRCVTTAHLDTSMRLAASDQAIPLSLNRGEAVRLRAPLPLALRVRMLCRVERSGDRWLARTSAYYYSLLDDQREILAYHWHPEQTPNVGFPHLHLEAGAAVGRDELTRAHLPTGFVPLAAVVLLAITDFDAAPTRDDWQETLAHATQARLLPPSE